MHNNTNLPTHLLIISLLATMLLSTAGCAPTTPTQTQPAPETQSPTSAEPTTAQPTEAPSTEATILPALTPDPQVLVALALKESMLGQLRNFDDGNAMINDYYPGGMLPGEFEQLSQEDKANITYEGLVNHAYAVLTYIKLGQMDDAKRLLLDLWEFMDSNDNFGDYLFSHDAMRGMLWMAVACEQYVLLTSDQDLLEFMFWLDWKGIVNLKPGFNNQSGQRITGDQPDFWGTESDLEKITAIILRTELLEKYGADVYSQAYPDIDIDYELIANNERLNESAAHIHEIIFRPDNGKYYEGFNMVHTFANVIQVLCMLEARQPDAFISANTYIHDLFRFAEENFSTTLTENGKTYSNLYRAANEEGIPVSFEGSLQMAIAYKMAADALDERAANPERTQKYFDAGMTEINNDLDAAPKFRQIADEIFDSVMAYTEDMGYVSVPYASQTAPLFTRFGWQAYRAPAMGTLAQVVQFHWGTFFDPILPLELASFTKTEGRDKEDPYMFYAAYPSMDEPVLEALIQSLESNGISYVLEVSFANGERMVNLFLNPLDKALKEMGFTWEGVLK